MENEHKNPQNPNNQNWLDDILGAAKPVQEIGPDEQAVSSAGLTHPDDLELDRIMKEVLQSSKIEQTPESEEFAEPDAPTQQFTPPQEEAPAVPEPTPTPPAAEQPAAATPVRKGRPAPKKGYGLLGIPHILSTVIWLLIILAVGVSLGRMLWVCCADVMAFDKESREVIITITENDNIDTVSDKLGKAGLVRYPGLFKLFAQITGKDDNISTGTFTLNAHLDYNAMINSMGSHSTSREEVDIMFPEGYNCAQIFRLLETKGVCSVADLEAYAANGELDDYWFLEGVKRGSRYCLEGYLFPDTYQFYLDDEPENAIEKLLDGFDYRFSDLMKEKLDNLNKTYGTSFKLKDIVNMAAMIQKEKATDLEGYTIASVFYNRLTHAASFPLLNCDSTILYAVEAFGLATDAQINASPYNTYTQPGLPAGPICNPGLSSLDAALEPEDSKYYYFVLDKETNRHVFSKTYDEHQRWLNKLGY